MGSSRRLLLAVAVGGAVAAVGGVLWWFSGDEPAPVDAERAIDQDDEEASIAEDLFPENGAAVEPLEDLTGRWHVDTTRPLDLAEGRGTFVGYRIEEEVANVGASTAIGRTPDVGGHIEFASTSVVSARVDADLTTLVSDDPRRDRRVQSMLGPDAQASFVLNDVIDPGEVPRIGEIIELDVDGTLTIRDISRPVEARVQVGVIERGMVVTGSLSIALDDFDLEVPSAAIVLSASEEATIEWQLFFARDAS